MKKRIASIALSLAMCLTLLPTAAYAEDVSEGGAFDSQPSTVNGAATVTGSNEAVDTTKNTVVPTNGDVENLSDEGESGNNTVDAWGGTADTSWYTEADANATGYHITTAEQLAGLAKLVNDETASVSFENKTIYLDNDLDLSDKQWVAIGNGDNHRQHFAGTFDGKYHKIMNLYHHYTGEDLTRNGLFGVISSGGTVKNLMVVDADIVSNDCSLLAGILADWVNGGTVENCYTSGKIENNVGDKMVGGLIGQCTWRTQVKGCGSDAIVVSTETNDEHVDTVGGLIGQWETSDPDSLIADCWFGGSVSCQNANSAVGGILGANFDDFSGNRPGVVIQNCMASTKNIIAAVPGNVTWIVAAAKPNVTNCIWSDSIPTGVELNDTTYVAVVKLVVDWDSMTAGADPNFDQSSCGNAVSDFKSADVLKGLQKHQGTGIEWVAGIKHPTFAWDKRNISADYTEVDKAIAAAKAIDGSRYTNYGAVEAAVKAVDRTKSKAEQEEVDAMAEAITKAIAALVEKSNSSSSGGGGSSTPRYAVTVPDKTENGSLSVSSKNAKKGSDVTITATPDKGCEVDEIVAKDANGNKLTLKDNGDGTYTFTMPASKVTIEATFAEKQADEPVAPEKLFADVSAEEYYYEAVKWASENGVTGGIGENLFGANLPCTRAQIVTFQWRAAGSPEPKGMSGFVDVSADAYYAKAVAWAVEQGIVSGTSATTFSPDAVCTRAQSVAFLYRAFGTRTDKAAGFSDVSADAYYADAVAWAVENGVASGIGGGLFAPDQDCARGQIVAFLYRAYQNK